MAKVSKKQEEVQTGLYPKEDAEQIQRLWKVVRVDNAEMEMIYNLYKKYINPNAARYAVNCNCHTSISNYWRTLLDWFSNNGDKFEK